MKSFESKNYSLCGEKIEIFYDTINNHEIETEDVFYFNLDSTEFPRISTGSCIVKHYFVANDEEGVGLCSQCKINGNTYSNTTYYEDEQWAQVFAGLSEEVGYYDDFSKLEEIRSIMNYNIVGINDKLEDAEDIILINKLNNLKIRNRKNELIGIAKDVSVFYDKELFKDKVVFVLNKIICNKIDKLFDSYYKLTIEIDEGTECILAKPDITTYYDDLIETGIISLKVQPQQRLEVLYSSDSKDVDSLYSDEEDLLDLSHKDLKMICLDLFSEVDCIDSNERKVNLSNFRDKYKELFSKKIVLTKYLLG